MANDEKLDELAFYLTEYPHLHDQSSWFGNTRIRDNGSFCGTTACAAGWTLVLNKVPLIIEQSWAYLYRGNIHLPYDRPNFHVPTKAQDILELNDEEANALFYGANTLDEVLETITKIKEGFYRFHYAED